MKQISLSGLTIFTLALVSPVLASGSAVATPAGSPIHRDAVRQVAQGSTSDQPITHHGAITLDMHQLAGSYNVVASGKAPAGSPITLTLLATIAQEIPDTPISHHPVTADENGNFRVILPVAPAFFRGAKIVLVATSLPGITKATAAVVLKAPNADVTVPADATPNF